MEHLKLYYFQSRGFAEISRLVLALAGQEYEDVRIAREDWAEKYKPEAPFGQGPFLEFTDSKTKKQKKIGQSSAIACFLAREFGLCGKNNWESTVVDQIIHLYKDLGNVWIKLVHEAEQAKKEELHKQMMEVEFPKYFGYFNKLFQESERSPFFFGDTISLADLYVYDTMHQALKVNGYDAGKDFADLKTLYDLIDDNPRIKAYVAQREDTAM